MADAADETIPMLEQAADVGENDGEPELPIPEVFLFLGYTDVKSRFLWVVFSSFKKFQHNKPVDLSTALFLVKLVENRVMIL